MRKMDVSVIIPVKNGEKYLRETFEALLKQTRDSIRVQICCYDDGSEDNTWDIINEYETLFLQSGFDFKKGRGKNSGGVGFAKNQAIRMSSGDYLCFNDADDISYPDRILKQYLFAKKCGEFVFLGAGFDRMPKESTIRYTRWANEMHEESIKLQIYTSHGPTLIAPTWFISRNVLDKVGFFNEEHARGYPEDLEIFYRCLDEEEIVFKKIESKLVGYRYHAGCASLGVDENSIWIMRLARLRRDYLVKWDHFTIWSAGKQGKKLFKNLNEAEKSKVVAFCDIDANKISRGVHEEFDESSRRVTHRVPIVHVRDARPPLVVCVKLDMTNGDLERLIDEQQWEEHKHLVYFG